jgi:hypothetical protein
MITEEVPPVFLTTADLPDTMLCDGIREEVAAARHDVDRDSRPSTV